jgi:acetyl esterase/lipase
MMTLKQMVAWTVLLVMGSASAADLSALPSTASKEAQAEHARILRFIMQGQPVQAKTLPALDDAQGWYEAQASSIKTSEKFEALSSPPPPYKHELKKINGVQVEEITPANWKNDGTVLVFVHGGAYVFGSATSTRGSAARVAAATGMRIVSVDYTLAPHAKWQRITDQVIAVIDGLRSAGYPMSAIGIYGDSAGGGLAGGSVLKLRDTGRGLPGAVVLWSPWADITESGDTYDTLKTADFLSYERELSVAARAYAEPRDQKNPYVSPVYGDYSKGYSPTLIQGGTREIFLSNFVRLYQALDMAGQSVKLDIYEGMPHVFQSILPDTPEARTALQKMSHFLKEHLRR